MRAGKGHPCAGFTYIAVILAVALMGTMLALTGEVWHTAQKREKERELLFVGNQFRLAIGQYFESTPGKEKQYPKKLEDLLEDNRFPFIKRHLRQIYRDPMTGTPEWGLVKGPGGVITGVYSLSNATALKTGNFAKQDEQFAGKGQYADWQFVYAPQDATTLPRPGVTTPPGAGEPGSVTSPGSDSTSSGNPSATQPPPDDSNPVAKQRADCQTVFVREHRICQTTAREKGPEAERECNAAANAQNAQCLEAVSAQ